MVLLLIYLFHQLKYLTINYIKIRSKPTSPISRIRTLLTEQEDLLQIFGVRNRADIIRFLNSCKSARGWHFFEQILRRLARTTNPNEAFQVVKTMTGHTDFEGVWEILQKMSSRKKHIEGLANPTGMDGVESYMNKITAGEGSVAFPGLFMELRSDVDWEGTFNTHYLGRLRLLNASRYLRRSRDYSGRVNLKIIITELYRITGESNLEKKINSFTKKRDPLLFLSNILDKESGHDDIIDLLQKLLRVTGAKVTGEQDIFVIIRRMRLYTNSDIIIVFTTLLRITNTRFFEWIEIIHNTLQMDIMKFFELVTSLSRRLLLDLFDAIHLLPAMTGSTDLIESINYVKENRTPLKTVPNEGNRASPILQNGQDDVTPGFTTSFDSSITDAKSDADSSVINGQSSGNTTPIVSTQYNAITGNPSTDSSEQHSENRTSNVNIQDDAVNDNTDTDSGVTNNDGVNGNPSTDTGVQYQ
ncbi:unnamed protein product [Leptidea sinapis]|uniref:Uncharacterized protein n=1 Tax=Leptidea sinapis TaxID=189913 RepID=A0A5E4PRP4_9NEOP|nr:unnamed protein product [Leptidea sinapis]